MNPYSANYVTHIMTHEIGHAIGLEHVDDPDDVMYHTASNTEYGIIEQQHTLAKRYGLFVPLCPVKNLTTLQYFVNTDDPNFGFDVYVVPSQDSFNDWFKTGSFEYYSDKECFAEDYLQWSGICEGISGNGGLLIILDDDATNDLVAITTKTVETSFEGKGSQETAMFIRSTEIVPKDEEKTVQSPLPISSSEDAIICGTGTILKDGKCVDPNYANSSTHGGGCQDLMH